MKQYFRYYLIVWAIAFIIFNVIVWVIPNEIYGYQKTAGAFWPGYLFVNISFLGMLPCGYIASQSENKDRLFLNIPVLTLSFTGLIIMLIVGSICMAVPGIPDWVGIIVCLAILGITVISIVSARAAAGMVNEIDSKVRNQASFIKSLTTDAQGLMNEADTDVAKAECKNVYEAIRYCDPVSSPAVDGVESQITLRFHAFADAVRNGNDADTAAISKELQILIKDRNNRCKLSK